jgi:hypothetical protein
MVSWRQGRSHAYLQTTCCSVLSPAPVNAAAIGELIAQQLVRRHGLTLQNARRRCYYMDSKGLVCAARLKELQHHKLPFAHDRCADAALSTVTCAHVRAQYVGPVCVAVYCMAAGLAALGCNMISLALC